MNTSMPTISPNEFKQRFQRAQKLVQEHQLDAVLVNSNEAEFANVRYFSDYWPIFETAGVIIPASGTGTLLIGPESQTFAEDRSQIERVRLMREYREPADPDYPDIQTSNYREAFAESGVTAPRRIGIAGSLVTTLPMIDGLRQAFPDAEIINADHIMTTLRSIKSEDEIACLGRAFSIAEQAIGTILESIKPGMTELEVVGIAQREIYANGAEYEGMPQYVFAGKNTTHAISRPTHRILEHGDLVQLNISARVNGYSSGVGRPIVLGSMTDAQRDLIEFAREAHEKVMGWLATGVNAGSVAQQYKDFFIQNGHADNFLYGPCHGLGMIEVEPPWMETNSDYKLETNMCFNVDTFAYRHGEFGLRWENGVVIKPGGVERLSNVHMELLEIT